MDSVTGGTCSCCGKAAWFGFERLARRKCVRQPGSRTQVVRRPKSKTLIQWIN